MVKYIQYVKRAHGGAQDFEEAAENHDDGRKIWWELSPWDNISLACLG